jgi:hypothetical protein
MQRLAIILGNSRETAGEIRNCGVEILGIGVKTPTVHP